MRATNRSSTTKNDGIKRKHIDKIQVKEPFKSLFPSNKPLIDTIAKDISTNGFDKTQQLIIWKETGILIDGHTRLEAAKEAKLKTVPIIEKSFESEEEAIEYAIHLQVNRRNLTEGELYRCITEIDRRNKHGGDRRSVDFKNANEDLKANGGESKSGKMTAALLGTSPTKVQKVRAIMDYGSEELKSSVLEDGITINKAYIRIKQQIKDNKKTADSKKKVNDETYIEMDDKIKAIRLDLHGYSSKEIKKTTQLSNEEITGYINSIYGGEIRAAYAKNLSVNEIAKEHDIDELIVWRYILEGSSDEEIFSNFGSSYYSNSQPKIGDVWNFGKVDKRLGIDYEGRAAGQSIMNILYRFSKQEDLVVDPMAGGGTTNDVCLLMNRRCKAYDINPVRDDIEQNDIREGFPSFKGKADLVILDPPYYKKKVYQNPEIMENREAYLDFIEKIASYSTERLKKRKYIALLFSQYIDYENDENNITSADVIRIFEGQGLKHVIQINSPLKMHSQFQPYKIENAKKGDPWRMLPHSCDWEVFKKV